MFSFFPSHKAKNFLFVSLIILAAILGGCSTDPEDDANYPGTLPNALKGKWVFDSDNYYEIGENSVIYASAWEGADYGFEGSILFVSNYGADSGIIIIQYTKGAPNPAKKFTGIYFRNLTPNTVQLANAINLSDYSYADTETLEEA